MKKKIFSSLPRIAKSTFSVGYVLLPACLPAWMAHAQLKGQMLPVPSPKAPASSPTPPPASPRKQPVAPPKMGPAIPTTTPSTPTFTETSRPASYKLNTSLSILILGLDDATLRHAPNWESTDDNANSDADKAPASALEKALLPPNVDVGNRAPGYSQMVAAPLRRVLAEAGAGNVLDTPLDGPSIVRTLDASRLSTRVIDDIRSSMHQIEAQVLSPTGASTEIPAALQQDAFTALTRMGQAMGYRAVVALVAPAQPLAGAPQALLLLADTQNQDGQIIPISVPGETDPTKLAAAASASLIPRLSKWDPLSAAKIQTQANLYLTNARDAAAHGDLPAAQDYVNQAIGLQPNNAKAYVMLGDLLQKNAPRAATVAYSSALGITPDAGALWEKLALTYTLGNNPDWPNALDAAEKALSNGYDSALLRTIMASAEFGRAQIFTKAGRDAQADAASRQAKDYLDEAMNLLPRDSSIDEETGKLIASNLISAGRFDDAASFLDTAARRYPQNIDLQRLYAQALSNAKGRSEDAFVAWANVWQLGNEDSVPLDSNRYGDLANGFDKHIFNVAKAASVLTSSVASGAVPAATALPQVQQYVNLIKNSVDALRIMHPPAGRLSTSAQPSRLIAGDLFLQAVQSYAMYLQNGNQDVLARGGQLHYQAIDRLNAARKASQ